MKKKVVHFEPTAKPEPIVEGSLEDLQRKRFSALGNNRPLTVVVVKKGEKP